MLLEDDLTPFLTTATRSADMSEADWLRELERLFHRQRAINDLLTGHAPLDYVYDMLAEHGINPHEWEECAIDNIEHIITF